jgi:hypothetical protein
MMDTRFFIGLLTMLVLIACVLSLFLVDTDAVTDAISDRAEGELVEEQAKLAEEQAELERARAEAIEAQEGLTRAEGEKGLMDSQAAEFERHSKTVNYLMRLWGTVMPAVLPISNIATLVIGVIIGYVIRINQIKPASAGEAELDLPQANIERFTLP